jgi:FMN phosphatase YigB (HAD superfamily)
MSVSCQSPVTEVNARAPMRKHDLADLVNKADRVEVISTDVFDTLLLRNSRSERSRIMMGERSFSDLLAQGGWDIDADFLVEARLQAQQMAFRGLALREVAGEARLVDIIGRQLSLLGLPHDLVPERLRIELEVEKTSLVANLKLARYLRERRRDGTRIIAVSDTTLPTEAVRELIQHFHGLDLVDRIYSSADQGLTKRDGSLFLAVAEAEKVSPRWIVHIGDDLLADVKIPSTKGITVHHTPRHVFRRYLRSANGALTEVGRFVRARSRTSRVPAKYDDSAISFGHHVLGPIVTQFCLLIWLYAAEAEAGSTPCLMFCARGGVGIREAFERVLVKFGLPLRTRRENIMVSRLIAARAALLARSNSAIEELDREFRGRLFTDVAAALGGKTYDLPGEWHQPFSGQSFIKLLFGSTGVDVLCDIEKQNGLFTRHFKQLAADSKRIILCDTGLYGSTQRLLSSAFPDLHVESIQFARANYKGHSEEHFPKLTGLLVQQNVYSPFNTYSCVLRYWHLIESLFEPAVPSVRLFTTDEHGQVKANCGDISFGAIDPSEKNPLLAGALSYIDELPANGGAIALYDAEVAWLRLKHAIARPTEAELHCLEVAGRSVDFGRAEILPIFAAEKQMTLTRKLMSLKSRLWREGAIAHEFPILKHVLLPTLSGVLSLRGLMAHKKR